MVMERTAGWIRFGWRASAVAIVVVGSMVTILSAVGVASRDTTRSRQSFDTSAAAVASTLQLAMQHEADLVADAAAFVDGNPGVSNTEFATWSAAAQASARYPELGALGELVIVPPAALPAYEKRLAADRPTRHPTEALPSCPRGNAPSTVSPLS